MKVGTGLVALALLQVVALRASRLNNSKKLIIAKSSDLGRSLRSTENAVDVYLEKVGTLLGVACRDSSVQISGEASYDEDARVAGGAQ